MKEMQFTFVTETLSEVKVNEKEWANQCMWADKREKPNKIIT